MAQIPYADSTGRLSVKVELKHSSDVFLLDRLNYQKYNSGQKYEYFGGNYTQSPVNITVQGSGRWYLIVDNGGSGEQYSYNFY